ncbi:MAG TPA: VWA domain-containing protein [Acidobacteriaceae bacterium]|nr:VWA domain-containing protein [Acidobacteriaceae bacterium]
MRLGVLTFTLALPFVLSGQQQNQSVPDAPTPQTTQSLGDLASHVTPGQGSAPPQETSQAPAAAPPPQTEEKAPPPEVPAPGRLQKEITTFVQNVNFVALPVTVLDRKHNQVAGLTYRNFQVYENNERQHISFFSADPMPLSVALVIDQSLPQDVMEKVNDSLGAIQGAFTPSDEIALFTYSNGVNNPTTFTAAQGKRLPAVLAAAKRPGDYMDVPVNGGPFFGGPQINGHSVDPNLEPGRDARGPVVIIPKDIHTLNDAILEAGKSLSTRPHDRRRIIYVISDGKESRSRATFKEVVRYLQGNQVSVYGTLVGDSATWGLGYLDKFKLPLLPLSPDNILPRYVDQTGGHLESEFSQNGIERSFADLAALARTQYTIGFYSHVPLLDSKFRVIDVRVNVPNLTVIAEKGYYPTATNLNR